MFAILILHTLILHSGDNIAISPNPTEGLVVTCTIKAVGSGEAGEALASPDFRPNSNISALTFFNFRVINM